MMEEKWNLVIYSSEDVFSVDIEERGEVNLTKHELVEMIFGKFITSQ